MCYSGHLKVNIEELCPQRVIIETRDTLDPLVHMKLIHVIQ